VARLSIPTDDHALIARLGLNKGLENLQRLVGNWSPLPIASRFRSAFPLFQRMALPIMAGKRIFVENGGGNGANPPPKSLPADM
jgi:hypothetical protein